MKTLNRILSILLVLLLALCLAACALGGSEETTKPVVYVPATQPDWSDETTGPIYTRPGDDEEDEDITLENPDQDGESDDSGNSGDADSGSDSDTGSADTDADTGDTFADGSVTSNPQGSTKNLSWSNINSFSIKSSSMSVAQMRKLCVDFFRYAKTALWTPDESISYIMTAKGSTDSMTGGTLYGGLPYVRYGTGNVYRMMDYIDEATGLMDMKKAISALGTKDLLEVGDMRYFGNQCANGAYLGWGRVINSVYYNRTYHMVPANGYVFLGDVEFDRTITRWTTSYTTKAICQKNGEQVLFAAYAKLQKADGLVYYTTAGHVIMVATDAHVEYVPNTNLIDGSKSYITIIDQAGKWETYTNTDGRTYQIKSSVDAKVTFQQLYKSNYLPFTYKEFLGTDPVEVTEVSLVGSNGTTYSSGTVNKGGREFVGSQTANTLTWTELFSSKVVSNYAVADAYIIVTDAGGNELYKHAVRATVTGDLELELVEEDGNVSAWETKTLTPGRTYNVSIQVQLYTGERPTIYTGQLEI